MRRSEYDRLPRKLDRLPGNVLRFVEDVVERAKKLGFRGKCTVEKLGQGFVLTVRFIEEPAAEVYNRARFECLREEGGLLVPETEREAKRRAREERS
jgi:hypothetical protein